MSAWGEFGGRRVPSGGTAGEYAALIALLRTSADELAVDLATWQARDPADPSPVALQARSSAIAATDRLMDGIRGLRRSLADEPDGGRL